MAVPSIPSLLKCPHYSLFLLAFLIPSTTYAQQSTHSPSRTMTVADKAALTRALNAEDQGRSQQAEPVLLDLVSRYPASFEATEALGLLYAEQGNFTDALPLLEKAASLSRSLAPAYANLGAAYLKLNRNEDAVRALKKAAALDPQNAQTQSNLGLALMQVKQPAQAAMALSIAARKNPADTDLLYNWALALFDAGQLAKAGEVLGGAPNVESSAQAQSLLGDIEEKQGHYQQAGEHMQKSATLDPSEANIYALGLEFLRHWTFDPGIKVFEAGMSRYPDSARLRMGLGIAKYANNDFSGAAPVFAQLLARDPDNDFYASLLGHSCSLIPDESPGCDALEGFAQRHPQNAAASTYAAASILHRPSSSENLNLARTLLDRAIAADPKSSEAYYQKGIVDQQQNLWQESIDPLEKAIALKSDFSKAHYRLGLAYSHSGQREKAQEQIALQQKFSQQEKDDLNAKFKEVTTFLVNQPQ